MIEKLKGLFVKYKSEIAYLFFGGCTTLLNIAVYWLLYTVSGMESSPAVALAWLASVIFAFVTNKLFVFDSRSTETKLMLREAGSFFLFRVITGLLDLGIMYLAVDVSGANELLWKCISNVIVIVLNYFAGKLLVFAKKK